MTGSIPGSTRKQPPPTPLNLTVVASASGPSGGRGGGNREIEAPFGTVSYTLGIPRQLKEVALLMVSEKSH